jgi:hypothetical protein
MDRPKQSASFSSVIGGKASHRAVSAELFIVCVITLTVRLPSAAAPAQASGTSAEQGVVVRQESASSSPSLTMVGEPPGQITADAIALGSFNPGPVVKGAPYSAEATTEVIQTFVDGNRIVRSTSALLYRDSRGRTRREIAMGDVAGIVVTGNPLRVITIHDPDSRTTQVFGPDRRVMQVGTAAAGPPPMLTTDVQQPVSQPVGTPEREESLGTRTIEGLVCEGTRKTTTIPAGAIGNDRPMTTVTERWFSQELQLLVLSRVSDPRFGETTYRLRKIVRAEPPTSLFEAPR